MLASWCRLFVGIIVLTTMAKARGGRWGYHRDRVHSRWCSCRDASKTPQRHVTVRHVD